MLSSKSREERKVASDEKSGLMSHEYDSVCTGDDLAMSSSNSHREHRRRAKSPVREIESEYSEIRRELITRNSRSTTPTDNSLISGIRSGAVLYGAVGEDRQSGFVQGRGSRTPGSVSSHAQAPSDIDVSGSEHTSRMRVNTSILQVGRLSFFLSQSPRL